MGQDRERHKRKEKNACKAREDAIVRLLRKERSKYNTLCFIILREHRVSFPFPRWP